MTNVDFDNYSSSLKLESSASITREKRVLSVAYLVLISQLMKACLWKYDKSDINNDH